MIRALCVVAGVVAVGWTGFDLFRHDRGYDAWLAANATELGEAQRAISRYDRRLSSGRYKVLPAAVQMADAEAAEVAEPVVARLDSERRTAFEALGRTRTRFKVAIAAALLLAIVAKALPDRYSEYRGP